MKQTGFHISYGGVVQCKLATYILKPPFETIFMTISYVIDQYKGIFDSPMSDKSNTTLNIFTFILQFFFPKLSYSTIFRKGSPRYRNALYQDDKQIINTSLLCLRPA